MRKQVSLRSFTVGVMLMLACLHPVQAVLANDELALGSESESSSRLQTQLSDTLADLGLSDAVDRGDLSVALAVITVPGQPVLAMVNGHRMMYAASLPKIAILLGAAVELEAGHLELTAALEKDLNDMIRVSCNACATRVLNVVGRERLLEILQMPGLEFYDPDTSGGLWVGKEYGPGEAYRRDPLTGLSHGATAYQAARFYYLLHQRSLVSRDQSELMLRTLERPGLSHKFVKPLKDIRGAKLFRKSGTWKTWHSDSVLVEYAGHAYVLVALANHPNGARWLESLASRLHDIAIGASWEVVESAY